MEEKQKVEIEFGTPSIKIQNPNGEMDIDLYGCLYPADIMKMAKLNPNQ